MPPDLLWRRSSGKTKALKREPFKSESDFEKVVFETPAMLGEIYLLQRQVRGGKKTGVPDIIGIDADGAVCVIEMKNVPVDAGIIPQVMGYAIWAESNPDSIRALWLQAKDRPDQLDVNWDDYAVRILVVAPEIDRSTLEHVGKITYPVDLIEVSRWRQGKNEWLLVNRIEPPPTKKTRPVSGLKEYGRDDYAQWRNPQSVTEFLRACDLLSSAAEKHGWPVERRFKKNYCAFTLDGHHVFGVHWWGTRSYGIFFKVPESFAKKTRVPGYKVPGYGKRWGAAWFDIEADTFKPSHFKRFIEKALEHRSQ